MYNIIFSAYGRFICFVKGNLIESGDGSDPLFGSHGDRSVVRFKERDYLPLLYFLH
jgi:hypothetical protein